MAALPAEQVLAGQPASAGQVFGPLAIWRQPELCERQAGSPPEERTALQAAIAKSIAEIGQLATTTDGPGADMLEFQSAMLEDQELRAPALAAIAQGEAAGRAWSAAVGTQIAQWQAAPDEYFRARTSDLADLRDRVLRHLTGGGAGTTIVAPGSIIAAEDFTPSQFLETDWSRGGGLVLASGSPSSHVAMLARSRGIPMVVGLGGLPLAGHSHAIVDGDLGRILLSPALAARRECQQATARAELRRQHAQAALSRPAASADGTPITMLINISGPDDLAGIDAATCDGIGLFRTELMFRDGAALPDENAQYHAYRRCLDWAGGKPVTIRALDIGGDKPIRGLTPVGESNPFLGSRGIRLLLARPDVFGVQLRALARAALHGNLKIMLPMISVPAELTAAGRLLDDVVAGLAREGIACRRPPLGIMIEVPAAALMAATFTEAAFFSIGSNDLTQYVMAASRDTSAVAALGQGAPPAVLKLMTLTVAGARELGIEVSLCGDMAGDAKLLGKLLATGLRALSVAPPLLGQIKHELAAMSLRGGDGQP